MSTESASVLKKYKIAIVICVISLIAVATTSAILYYDLSRSYYFEQNMHTYAVMETWLDLNNGMDTLANDVNYNKSALNQIVPEAFRIGDAADRLEYMDPPQWQAWFSLSTALSGLRGMAQGHYFFNDSTDWVAQVYQDILSLSASINNAPIGDWGSAPSGSYLYNQGVNRFSLNSTVIQNIGQVSGQLSSLMKTNAGEDIFR